MLIKPMDMDILLSAGEYLRFSTPFETLSPFYGQGVLW